MKYTQSDGPQIQSEGEPYTDAFGRNVWFKQVPTDEPNEEGMGMLNGVPYRTIDAPVSVLRADSTVQVGNGGDWLLYDGETLSVVSESVKSTYTPKA